MTLRLQILLCAFALSGCNCFVPVEECEGIRCDRLPDGGRRDGGIKDGGKADGGGFDGGAADGGPIILDAGLFPDSGTVGDAGTGSCGAWDGGGVGVCAAITGFVGTGTSCVGKCVQYPISTTGVYPTISACVRCGCDSSKLKMVPPGSPPIGPGTYCDQLSATTTLPRVLSDALGGPDSGFDAGCYPVGALNYECALWQRELGDAGFAQACAASLTPGVTEVRCFIFL